MCHAPGAIWHSGETLKPSRALYQFRLSGALGGEAAASDILGGFNKLFVSGRDFSFRQLPDNGRKGAIRSPESRNSRITHKVTAAAFRNIIISGAFRNLDAAGCVSMTE